MTNLLVKICGITRPQDAELAIGLGAHAVGFVFWPDSPRRIDPQSAKTIAAGVPAGVAKVGVFVDETVEEIARVMDEAGLDVAQLHGHESPEFCRELKVRLSAAARSTDPSFGETRRSLGEGRKTDAPNVPRRVMKAIGLRNGGVVNVSEFDSDIVLLLDAHDPERRGGTGKTVNWDVARDIAAMRPAILAGGLNAANIKLAIRSVRPYGIDVSSGVESSPGIKDPNRMRSFFEALHD